MIRISFVVPVYNGAGMVGQLLERLLPVGRSFGSFEVIFVDDGSRDDSFAVLSRLADQVPEVSAVQLSRNFGQHNATLAGLAQATGEIVVTLDQDLQNPPEEIPRLVAMLDEGFDVVYGLPAVRPHSPLRNLASDFSKWIARKIFTTALNGNFSSFRVMRHWLVTEVTRYSSGYIYLDGLINWTTVKTGGLKVRNDRPDFGSQYSWGKLVNHGMNLLVNFSIQPLQIGALAGCCTALIGLLAAVVITAAKIFYDVPVQGWASMMVVILLLGGMQLAFLGLIGEYIGRILLNSNQAPKYIVREIHRSSPS